MTNRMGEKIVSSPSGQVIAGDYAPGQFVAGPNVVIHRRLGHGLSATVYEVEAAMLHKGQVKPLGRRLALKVLHRLYSSNPEMIERLVGEATTLGNVRHPNVVQIYSAGFTQGEEERAYIVMELLDGTSGRDLLGSRNGSGIAVQTVIDVAIGLASGLAAVHAAGVVHQDIKPENIYVTAGESGPLCKIFDLGVQRKISSTGEPMPLGGTEEWSGYQGTPTYSAPEQLEGKPITPRTDIYAFGVLLFEFLTGKRPYFEAEAADRAGGPRRRQSRTTLPAKSPSPDEPRRGSADAAHDPMGSFLVSAKLTQEAPRLSAHAIVPPRLESLVASCLERDPSRRPASAEAVENELQEILDELAPVFKNHTQTTQQFLTSALRRAREQQEPALGEAEVPAIGPTPPLVPEMRAAATPPLVPEMRAATPTPPLVPEIPPRDAAAHARSARESPLRARQDGGADLCRVCCYRARTTSLLRSDRSRGAGREARCGAIRRLTGNGNAPCACRRDATHCARRDAARSELRGGAESAASRAASDEGDDRSGDRAPCCRCRGRGRGRSPRPRSGPCSGDFDGWHSRRRDRSTLRRADHYRDLASG